MKRASDEELHESLKNLDENLRLKSEHYTRVKERILLESKLLPARKRSYKKPLLSIVATLMILLGFSPMYSTTMASFAAKFLPLEIKPESMEGPPEMVFEIPEIIEQAGYVMGGLGITPNPYTIEIGVQANDDSLKTIDEKLRPLIEEYLNGQGMDQYELAIKEEKVEEDVPVIEDGVMTIYDSANTAAMKVFEEFGYPGIAQIGQYTEKDQSMEIEMPDHIEEAEEIQAAILENLTKQGSPIKEIKLNFYNAEEREKEMRVYTVADDIYRSLAGKSLYTATGYSVGYTDGIGSVQIKTKLSKNTSQQILTDIESALQTYFSSPKVKQLIGDDQYKIQILIEGEKVLLEYTNQ